MNKIDCKCGCGNKIPAVDKRGRPRSYKYGHGNLVKDTATKFWSKVDRSGVCWRWKAAKDHNGYGAFDWRIEPKAHRMAWRLTFGDIPAGVRVLHRCDVRDCVNPDHLFLGSDQDNSTDMVMKGRSARGEQHPRSKLTESDVIEMRLLHSSGVSYSKLATKYGVSKFAVSTVIRRQTWKHI